MSALGAWDRPGYPETFDFATPHDLTINRTDDAGDEHATHFTYVYNASEKKLITKHKSTGSETVYTVRAHTEIKLELESSDGAVVSLIPSGYDGGAEDADPEGNDSGVDLGMELCVVGTKIGK